MSTNHKSKDHTVMNIGKKCKKCIFRVPNVLRRQNSEAYTPDVVSIGPFHYYPEKRGKEELSGVSIGPFHYYPEKRGKEELKGGKEDFQLMEQVKQSYLNEILACTPDVLRRQNSEAYTPDVVSIGPFQYYPEKRGKEELKGGKEDFQLMEQVKQSYLNEILTGMKITLEELTAKVTELSDQKNEGCFEERARSFYAEKFGHISSTDFIKMMIVDGCFLIQLFRKCDDPKLRAFDDSVFNMDCMFHFLCHDILLLENQLPWFVIHILYSLIIETYPNQDSLSFLILKAFSMLPSLKQGCLSYSKHLHRNNCHFDADYLHILDLIRSSILVPLRTIEERAHKAAGNKSMSNPGEHEVDSGNKHRGNNEVVHEAILDPDLHQIRTASELSKADIKFKSVEKDSIMDIQFKEGGWFRNGILEIPPLNVGMSSETLFRNLIAIEQCYHGYSNEITSYAIFMDNLISSKEDMELLCKKKVIGNLMSDEDGCKFFSNLYKDIPHNKFYYVELCKQVNARYNLTWYTLLALLKFEKFSNPWKVLAFVIAIIVLTLTAWNQTNHIRVNWHK